MNDDFRRALEEVKLRAPVEDVVREYVPELRKRGSLWVACCPFHDERTPSFKVDPRRGTWHCFGACSEGGDQIRFVERMRNVGFRDALEILAARAGVELPRAGAPRPGKRAEDQPILALLERAAAFFETCLEGPEGAAARAYLARRGLSEESARAFRLGWAPVAGRALSRAASARGVSFEDLARAGLARRNDQGHTYDFFRGRLVIPIQDLEGRVVGFGARQIEAEANGPKYVNSPETELFRKSRLIYGLDRALATVRKTGHLVLVEGYTDVIAAHQAGVSQVGAVLGTATTVEHAATIRRTGARRISLVFDGDEAGRRAARRALDGLLPLGVELEIVAMPAGEDPCDLLIREGKPAFEAALAAGRDWFSFLLDGLSGLSGAELSEQTDALLELLARIEKPVHREDLTKRLAERLDVPRTALDAQWRLHPAARPRRAPVERDPVVRTPARPSRDPRAAAEAARCAEAWRGLVVAALRDESLVPALRERVPGCPDPDLARVLEVLVELYETSSAAIDESSLLGALLDHPARTRVVGLFQEAASLDAPRKLLEDNLQQLRRLELDRELRDLSAQIVELQCRLDNEHRRDGEVAADAGTQPDNAELVAVTARNGDARGPEPVREELARLVRRSTELRSQRGALGGGP